MKKLLISAFLAAFTLPAFAQPIPDADPALWVVKDEDTTIYMFGTIHMLDGKREWFNDEVKTAFDKADEMVLEAVTPEDPKELQPIVLKYAFDMSGRKLSDKLPLETRAKLEKAINEAKLPANARQGFEVMKPWFASMTLSSLAIQKLGFNPASGAEATLTRAAKEKGVKIGELEGFEQQLAMFDQFTEEQQIALLTDGLDDYDKVEETLEPMLDAWSTGDAEGLAKLMEADDSTEPALHKILIADRNARWADWIDKRLEQPGTVFLAVGAMHLAGKDSVQNKLAERGIKSERVVQ